MANEYTGKFRLRYSSEFDKAPAVRWQIKGLLPLGGVTVLHGPPKSFKTYIAQSMALSCACGLPWQGLKTRNATVLYVGPEGFFGLIRRQRAWEQSNSHEEPVPIAYWQVPVNFNSQESTKEALAALQEQEVRPDFIVVDTLQRASVGADENSVKDMGQVFDNLNAFLGELAAPDTERPPTCLIIHHDTKDGRGFRGSSSIFGAVDGMLSAESKDGVVMLSCDAFREGEAFQPIRVLFHPAVKVMTEDGWQTEVAVRAHVTQDDRLDDLLNRPASEIKPPRNLSDQTEVTKVLAERGSARFTDLQNATGLSKGRLTRALAGLESAGQVNKGQGKDAKEGMYTLNGIGSGGLVRFGPGPKDPGPIEPNQSPTMNPDPIEPIEPNQSNHSVTATVTAEPLRFDTVDGIDGACSHNISDAVRKALDGNSIERDRLAEGARESNPEAASST